jgi:hypothetical protein
MLKSSTVIDLMSLYFDSLDIAYRFLASERGMPNRGSLLPVISR